MNERDLQRHLTLWGLDAEALNDRLDELDARHRRAFRTVVEQSSGSQLRAVLERIVSGEDNVVAGCREAAAEMGKGKSQAYAIIADPRSPMFTWAASDGMIITMQSSARTRGEWWDAVRPAEAHDNRIRRSATDVSSRRVGR